MYCPLLLYDIVYEYCLNDNFGLSKYYSSIATEIDENYLNQIYNLTNNSYNHIDNNSNTNINDPHRTLLNGNILARCCQLKVLYNLMSYLSSMPIGQKNMTVKASPVNYLLRKIRS